MGTISRRHVVVGAAWSVPVVVAVGAPAAWAACSGPVTFYTPSLTLSSSTTTKDANGHTIGYFYFDVRDDGATTIPAGATYTATITAEKSPGSTSKDILVTPQTSPGITPSGRTAFNPDGGGSSVVSKTYSLVLPTAVVPGATFRFGWYIDSETGIGATRLRFDVTLVTYSTNSCGETTTGTSTTVSAYWGAR